MTLQDAQAQKSHYVYLQSENNQPYYIELLGNTFSSNATGYLLVPQLSDGTYTMRVGFAKTLVEHGFTFQVTGADKGFSLKQGVDNNWSLFDLVDFTIIKGAVIVIGKETAARPEAVPEAGLKPMDTVKIAEVMKQENPLKAKTVETVSGVQPEKSARVFPVVQKIYDKTGPDGAVDQVYVIFNAGKSDTVIIFVPVIPMIKEQTRKTGARVFPANHPVDGLTKLYARCSVRIRPAMPIALNKPRHAQIFPGTLL